MINKRPAVISLFAGAGGLNMGFERHGYKIVWANGIDKDACETHKLWSKTEVVCGYIRENNGSIND
ncbi:hypothetical protein BA173_01805 [Rickettsia sp. MEAM1 (Bemisia tabaci)]|uniref:DNA cytosine methyltransferase n=1 Tax=unclassified Rickettsia TaxID=114295 RepID=UPI00082A01AB|nr:MULTISPECIES: DNA cytosine methyltransferase [unclassified Rickettsia]ASX27627.1 hypothetical protein BA173_01745 [Rickettsia sp. MEAM1 (Bemisia tabaci)]ASX27633.1 hypothetical protein BA173_01780 [Rickettsia sp. MEAM1 (Bemisia tabaci)]ASX27637.1 hypothetical protein BA173_01805 [Rickettsia sp. MEAM1 (Bemisia tabaci)]ODA36897.1 hypothetical protein A8V33_03710 [Rickettsia sp. wb]ODA38376.1 hypothetical protein A8V34_01490 [Rickettsia sp. wq]